VTDDETPPQTSRTMPLIGLAVAIGVMAIGLLTFLSGPFGFFVAMGLFVGIVAVVSFLHRRHDRRSR